MTESGTTIENEEEQIKQCDFKIQNEKKAKLVPEELYSIFYAIYNCYIFSNVDNL